ncbi:carbohydrate ABC transporter permease [Jonesiaceae bacterium BS-20]|uniref:Carbohydrate ABC transporter permease n=1 Tax=Jonesiaceae bacterium BS-20 TaxID=3120821 RepID=A0AAU7DVN4_9MICO
MSATVTAPSAHQIRPDRKQVKDTKTMFYRLLQYISLAFYLIFLGFPLLWLISASFKSSAELNSLTVSLIPQDFHLGNFPDAFEKQGLISSAGNSLFVALLTTLLVILISLPGAYALARFKGKIRAFGTGWILVSQVFPVILIIIPLFMILKTVGLVDNLWGLVLVYTTYTMPFALWMLQGYVASIPVDLEEAGAIDGASRLKVLITIVFPLLKPGLIATAMFSFVSAWNEFFFALVLIQSPENYTLPITLKMFVGGEGKVALGPLAAGAVLATIPSVIFFAVLQRKLAGGMLAGAVKG